MYKLILFCFICLMFTFCHEKTFEKRDRIIFNNSIPGLKDTIQEMQTMLDKLPESEVKNYYVTDKGQLVINNTIIGDLEELVKNQEIETIKLFANFSKKEIQSFLNNILFLKKNFITSAYKDLRLNKVIFVYKMTEENSYDDNRGIMLIEEWNDTLSLNFRSYKKILDRKGNLIIVAPRDAHTSE